MPPDPSGHIAFVGFMGAGKSTTAELVARRLDRPWFDTDHVIVERCGRSIPELFAAGEQARFRAMETAVIAELLDGPPAVLSLGGGALEDSGTRELLLARAFVVWLEVSWSEVRAELPSLMQTRPLLQDRTEEEIHALFERRQATYDQAHLRLHAARGELRAVADRVVAELAG
ncbi:MAG TPA: shikimate kinase [Solirubrobacteraceae bacterium]|nr:shikimate kinase [Solirubrobacteraceae bacterium]